MSAMTSNGLGYFAEGLVVADELGFGVEGLVVALPVDSPAAVVGVEDGDLGVGAGAGEGGAGFEEVGANLGDFGVERDGGSVRSD